MKGCAELAEQIDIDFDIITTACGTGATLAGLASALKSAQQAIGYAALKGGEALQHEVQALLPPDTRSRCNWRIEADYHFGGYARINNRLIAFMRSFHKNFGIALDAVYTAKMFYGLFQLIDTGALTPGSRIVALHSGGLQGNAGFTALADLRSH